MSPSWSLTLESGALQLPSGLQACGQTVLLEVEVHPEFPGRVLSPWIEIRHEGGSYRQYLQRGSSGRSQLNLSPLFQAAEKLQPGMLRLHTRGLRCANTATLRVFAAPRLVDASIMVIAPHPDDAEIACFGLYATHPASIVTLTAGERGAVSPGADLDAPAAARWRARLRVEDSLSIPARGGVPRDRCVNLAYPDGALAELFARAPSAVPLSGHDAAQRAALRQLNGAPAFRADAAPTWPAMVRELADLLELHAPSIVCCPHPALDDHPDHVFAAVALDAALEMAAVPAPQIFLYVVHAATATNHPFGPSTSVQAPPPGQADAFVADSIYSHRLDAGLRERKRAAIAAHLDVRERMTAVSGARARLALLRRRAAASLPGTRAHAESFLRRGPRPNEIYYLVSRASFAALLAARTANAGR